MDVTTIAQDALNLLGDNAVFHAGDLGRIELLIRDHVQRIGARMLEPHLASGRLGDEGSSRACRCGTNQKFVDHRPRLGKEQTRVLPARATAALAVHDPFAPSAELLLEVSRSRLSQRWIHRMVRHVGAVAADAEKQRALRRAACQAVEALVRPRRLYVTVDGFTIPLDDGWHEAKCVCCYWDDERGKRQSRRMVRLESAEQFAAFAWSLACQCGLDHADDVILLGDGAAWIWDRIASVLGERTICITDWHHVSEHAWACGKPLFGQCKGVRNLSQYIGSYSFSRDAVSGGFTEHSNTLRAVKFKKIPDPLAFS